jgi:1,4-alpha-glucan branching enzyme
VVRIVPAQPLEAPAIEVQPVQRRADDDVAVVALNFTPVPRPGYRLGVPRPGGWREALNSDSRFYGGSDLGNAGVLHAEPVPWMHQPWSVVVTLPPLAGLVLAQAPGFKPSA